MLKLNLYIYGLGELCPNGVQTVKGNRTQGNHEAGGGKLAVVCWGWRSLNKRRDFCGTDLFRMAKLFPFLIPKHKTKQTAQTPQATKTMRTKEQNNADNKTAQTPRVDKQRKQ